MPAPMMPSYIGQIINGKWVLCSQGWGSANIGTWNPGNFKPSESCALGMLSPGNFKPSESCALGMLSPGNFKLSESCALGMLSPGNIVPWEIALLLITSVGDDQCVTLSLESHSTLFGQ